MTDPAGDTFIDGTQTPITQPRADIVKAGAAFESAGIAFAAEVSQPVDPRSDPNWASGATFVAFDVDTNGDGKPDFEVQYFYDGTQYSGSVIHPGDTDTTPPVCSATGAGYAQNAYVVVIDPACLGNPASFAFRVTMFYDTNPKDQNSNVASDVAPDGGLSFPVTKP